MIVVAVVDNAVVAETDEVVSAALSSANFLQPAATLDDFSFVVLALRFKDPRLIFFGVCS